jgi:hypothetical protein
MPLPGSSTHSALQALPKAEVSSARAAGGARGEASGPKRSSAGCGCGCGRCGGGRWICRGESPVPDPLPLRRSRGSRGSPPRGGGAVRRWPCAIPLLTGGGRQDALAAGILEGLLPGVLRAADRTAVGGVGARRPSGASSRRTAASGAARRRRRRPFRAPALPASDRAVPRAAAPLCAPASRSRDRTACAGARRALPRPYSRSGEPVFTSKPSRPASASGALAFLLFDLFDLKMPAPGALLPRVDMITAGDLLKVKSISSRRRCYGSAATAPR